MARSGTRAATYTATLPSEPPNLPASFSVPGLAARGATPLAGRHPLVAVSHGYSNATAALSWLTENLASIGYVVAAIRHEDPPISDRNKVAEPLLLIAGDRDRSVDYTTGARTFFDAASGAQRYLLTYKNGGHNLGLAPVPDSMRQRLWDLDWFEDPVWRKDRIVAINLHMITAFLDLYVRDDQSRSAYIDDLVPDSTAGNWPADQQGRYDAYSPGTDGITVWKGFQRRHAGGLELRHATPRPLIE